MIGRADIEDALKRLDRLTQEETRMAMAQVLKTTHSVDNRVRGVDDRMARVKQWVKDIDGKVGKIIDGKRITFGQLPKII